MKGGLLEDMAAVGLDARIVKVASGGLEEDLLWGSLKDRAFRKKLERCVAKFGGSVLGEGGEYETLVVDGYVFAAHCTTHGSGSVFELYLLESSVCETFSGSTLARDGDTDFEFIYSPSSVWKGRLSFQEEMRTISSGKGGVAWINFKPGDKSGVVVMKDDQAQSDHWKTKMHSPKLWDAVFKRLLDMQVRIPGALIAPFIRFLELLDMFQEPHTRETCLTAHRLPGEDILTSKPYTG